MLTESQKAAKKRYRESEKGKAKEREYSRMYCRSSDGKAAHQRFRRSEKGIAYYKEYQRKYGAQYRQTLNGKAARKRGNEKYWATEKGKSMLKRAHKKYYLNNPEKRYAKDAIHNEIRQGRLVRQPCEVCGTPNAEAHHSDYSKPLEVRWLCGNKDNRHHLAEHVKLRQVEV